MADFRGGTTAEHAFAEHEHRDLAPGIDRIHEAACAAGSVAPADLTRLVLGVIDWIQTVLRPHAAWEDAWLYPEIARRAGSPWATKLMTFEHDQILEIARKLEIDRESLRHERAHGAVVEVRGHLFALEAVLRAHIEREERFLLPVIDTAVGEVPGGRRSP